MEISRTCHDKGSLPACLSSRVNHRGLMNTCSLHKFRRHFMVPGVQAFMLDRYHVDGPNFTPISLNVNGEMVKDQECYIG